MSLVVWYGEEQNAQLRAVCWELIALAGDWDAELEDMGHQDRAACRGGGRGPVAFAFWFPFWGGVMLVPLGFLVWRGVSSPFLWLFWRVVVFFGSPVGFLVWCSCCSSVCSGLVSYGVSLPVF